MSEISSSISLTTAAMLKISNFITAPGNEALKLRVYIEGGGCSGFQYQFEYDSEIQEDDILIPDDEGILVTDPMSGPYLKGAVIDYKESLQVSGFFVVNPNVQGTCSCGSSFSLKNDL